MLKKKQRKNLLLRNQENFTLIAQVYRRQNTWSSVCINHLSLSILYWSGLDLILQDLWGKLYFTLYWLSLHIRAYTHTQNPFFCLSTEFCFLSTCLIVISVPERVAERLEPSDDSSGPSLIDYSERRSLPISIPDYQTVDNNGEKYVVSLPFSTWCFSALLFLSHALCLYYEPYHVQCFCFTSLTLNYPSPVL